MVNKHIEIVKAINPNIVAIIGGPHPSGAGGECLHHIPRADFAFKGEAEAGLPALLKILQGIKESIARVGELESISGLIWKSEGGGVKVNAQSYVEDLDSLGFPAWDLLDLLSYPEAPQGVIFKQLPIAPMMITRGCPFPCTFCAGNTISGEKVRRRSIENVLGEIDLLYGQYGVRELHILDDNFTLDKGYVQQFCRKLSDRRLKLSWCCPNGVRLDTLDKEMLTWMKESGCYYISVGIESGSDRILGLMKKHLTVSQIKRQIAIIKEVGLDANGFFIIGYPDENEEEILETIHFACSLPLRRAAFYNFLPLPGTEIYNYLLESKQFQEPDWQQMHQTRHPYCPRAISRKRLIALSKKAYWDFYLRPHTIFSLLKEIKTLRQLKFIVRRVISYLS
jgi:radical SAM superfamily enzyme YgiQ (UPF0313 family)